MNTLRHVMSRLHPSSLASTRTRSIVAVIGTTGVGKSDLAVALAQSLADSPGRYRDAEVLSADSMQLYKGLDVITNKMTRAEMKGVKHWGMDVVEPGQGSWEVGRWCSEADKEVSLDSSLFSTIDRSQSAWPHGLVIGSVGGSMPELMLL